MSPTAPLLSRTLSTRLAAALRTVSLTCFALIVFFCRCSVLMPALTLRDSVPPAPSPVVCRFFFFANFNMLCRYLLEGSTWHQLFLHLCNTTTCADSGHFSTGKTCLTEFVDDCRLPRNRRQVSKGVARKRATPRFPLRASCQEPGTGVGRQPRIDLLCS